MRRSDGLWIAGRIFMGLVFLYAGYSKLMAPYENFRGAIAYYEVIPYFLTGPIALVLPWLELVFGAFIIVGYMPRVSALVLAFFSFCFLEFGSGLFLRMPATVN